MGKFIDLTGQRFGHLTVIERAPNQNGRVMWLCECDCPNKTRKAIRATSLRRGYTTSCGCMCCIGKHSNQNLFDNGKQLGIAHNKYRECDGYLIGYTYDGKQFYIDFGDYELVKNYSWYIDQKGYVKTSVPKNISMHRLIMCSSDNTSSDYIDHINHNPSDNRKVNLRITTNSQNQMNKCKSKNNSSGYKGVSWHKKHNKWISQIQINGKLHYLGLFKNIDDAVQARKNAEKQLFKEYNYNPSSWDLII